MLIINCKTRPIVSKYGKKVILFKKMSDGQIHESYYR